jgi:hypothetical protein
MTLLLQEAMKPDPDGRFGQYIFFTPHDISSAVTLTGEQKSSVKVIKMRPPERSNAGAGGGAADDSGSGAE